MAFQTSIFRDGAWRTETVSVSALLKSQQVPSKVLGAGRLAPPRCGLLASTVIESAQANFILPVRLRSIDNNDVAFVGDRFVQICELQKDGRLKEIIRKSDFGCRIRNACVVGSIVIPGLGGKDDDAEFQPPVKFEDDNISSFNFPASAGPGPRSQLPPQFLIIVLESGDNVLLFIKPGINGNSEFVASHFESPKHQNGYPGFNVAVDPSSRYLALAGPSDYFVVYEIESHQQLNEAYLRNEPLHPIRSSRVRTVRGVVHKMCFLYPRPEDPNHIILLLIIVRHGVSRMVVYEWELGNDLKAVFSEEKRGHRLPIEHQMSLLLIPLKLQSAFVLVSIDGIAVYTDCLHGSPRFCSISTGTPPTAKHHGRHPPLWVAWARPFRRPSCNTTKDRFYLAREDGVVLFFEADQELGIFCNDVDEQKDPLPCNISNAFACLLFDLSSDVLVVGSESGQGGYWRLPPRGNPELLGRLPNWSPLVDFTTTDEVRGCGFDAQQEKTMVPWQQQQARLPRPDRIFATCEDGSHGSITEFRYGLKAGIGLDLEYGIGMKQAWLLPSLDPSSFDGYLLLVSLPDSSEAQMLPSDFSSTKEPAAGTIPYDLTSTTLALACSGDLVVQVTKQTIILASSRQTRPWPCQNLQDLLGAEVSDAVVRDDCMVLSAHTASRFQIHVYQINIYSLTLIHIRTFDIEGEVTCLSVDSNYRVLAGIRKDSVTYLACGFPRQTMASLEMVNLTEAFGAQKGTRNGEHISRNRGLDAPSSPEGIASIVSVRDEILLGTRSGEVITLNVSTKSIDCEKFGNTTANLSCLCRPGSAEPTVLVSCDNTLAYITLNQHDYRPGNTVHPKSKLQIWPVDASQLDAPAPPVHYAAPVDMPAEDGVTPILMISGKRLLLADLHHGPGPVHRNIPIQGIPNRVIYYRPMGCLIAAVTDGNRPTLKFINPDTGEDIGRPTDKNIQPMEFIAGLGKEGDRILALSAWDYKKDGNVWNFVIVGTKSGRLIVVTMQKLGPTQGNGCPSAIRYWTRSRKEVKDPIYSVLGYDEGLIYCADRTVQWDILDTQEKRLKPLKSATLSSKALSLRISNGKLLAVTANDSLVILDHVSENDGGGVSASTSTSKPRHVDPWRRTGVDFIPVAGPPNLQTQTEESSTAAAIIDNEIFLVSDRECGVVGLWVPWQTPDRECEIVFEAELPTSIRRFRRGRTRPAWQQKSRSPMYGRLPATADDAEILGASLNGAMYQFAMLSVEAWRLLRYIQNLAMADERVCPFGRRLLEERGLMERGPEPRLGTGFEMHVDGDVLRRCLEMRALERVVGEQGQVERFVGLLEELEGGRYTEGLSAEGRYEQYFRLAYDILEYYLLPVI
ncbi:hypothetical protein VTI74DRAFT_3387 [Chaetomium olivicolor]